MCFWDTKTTGLSQYIRGELQDISGSKALAYAGAVENMTSAYNLNTIEGLYDAVSTLPIVNIREITLL